LGEPLPGDIVDRELKVYSVKMPMFSWSRLKGVDPGLGVEMVSTGEIACMGATFEEALLKSMLATESGIKLKGEILANGVDRKIKNKLTRAGFKVFTGKYNKDNKLPDMLIDFGNDGQARKDLAAMGVPVFTEASLVQAFADSLLKKPRLEARELKEYWRLSGMETHYKIGKIENGTVLDHLPANSAYDVLMILRVREEYPNSVVSMVTNVPSKRLGVKDILKIEGKIISPEEIKKVAKIAPKATINIIKDFEVSKKVDLSEK